MSDFWSGMFLLGTIIVGAILTVVMFVVLIIRRQKTRVITISIGIVFTLFGVWAADRFVVGAFCFPWECINRSSQLETLLLDNADLPYDWTVKYTFDYAYIPRASASYRERTFHRETASINNNFYEHIYQYSSVRGAVFQYKTLKKEMPTSYSIDSTPLFLQFDPQVAYASEHDFGCVFYDMRVTVCYYLARYGEYILLLEMPFSGNQIIDEIFSEIVGLADKKFSIVSEKN